MLHPGRGQNYYKCVTFYSHLIKNYRNTKIALSHMRIEFQSSFNWFPSHLLKNILIFIHSPNTFPDIDNAEFINVNPVISLEATYNQISTELLGEGYDTNCYEYDLDYKFANFNMRSDCIMSCIQNIISNKCNLDSFIYTGLPLRQKYLAQELNRIKTKSNDQNDLDCQLGNYNREVKFKCKQLCKPDCRFNYYPVSFDEYDNLVEWKNFNRWKFSLVHNGMPDINVKYLPQTTLLSLVCNFSGLLGMWLGLSIVNVLDELILKIKNIIRRTNIRDIYLQNNMFFTINNIRNRFNRTRILSITR